MGDVGVAFVFSLSLSFLYVWTGKSQLSWAADFMVLVG